MRPMLGIWTLTFLIGGCNVGSPDPPQRPGETEGETTITHRLEVDGITLIAEGITSRSKYLSEDHRSIQIGDHQIDLKDGELQINGRSFGEFTDGDEVEITGDGSVLVNGDRIDSRPVSIGVE